MGKRMKKKERKPGVDVGAKDDRFSALQFNPKFALQKKGKAKVKVDERFSSMFTDSDFTASGATVDKYGRKKKKKDAKQGSDLKRFYKMDEEEEKDASDEEKAKSTKVSKKSKRDKKQSKEDEEDERLDYMNRLARGEVSGSDSSSDEEDGEYASEASSDDEGDVEKGDVDEEVEEEEHIPTGEESKRIAVQNCDWDNLSAQDLLAILNSFVPSSGRILKVTVHPSQYGQKMMKLEETKGPMLDDNPVQKKFSDPSVEELEEGESHLAGEGDGYDPEKLRKYELNKLKYYFAVVECDSLKTASVLYRECDGVEYEHSSNVLDLRFIPDDMEINQPIRDDATSVTTNYKPPEFVTKALQQSKVDLTWDEDVSGRNELQEWGRNGLIKGREMVTEQDLEKFIASDHSDDEEEEENTKNKYKNLLSGILGGNDDDGNDQIANDDSDDEPQALETTFIPGLTERIMARKMKDKQEEDETPFERKQRLAREKRKEKRLSKKSEETIDPVQAGFNDPFFASAKSGKSKKRNQKNRHKRNMDDSEELTEKKEPTKGELELLMTSDKPGEKLKGFDFKTIVEGEKLIGKKTKLRGKKKKRKLEAMETAKQDDFKMDTNDSRFSELFTDPSFQIDRTDPKYVETRTMRQIESERAKRRREARNDDNKTSEPSNKVSIDSLVKSIKGKKK